MQDSQAHTSLPCAVKGKLRHPRAVRPGWLARAAFIFGVYSESFTSLPLTERPESKTGLHGRQPPVKPIRIDSAFGTTLQAVMSQHLRNTDGVPTESENE